MSLYYTKRWGYALLVDRVFFLGLFVCLNKLIPSTKIPSVPIFLKTFCLHHQHSLVLVLDQNQPPIYQ